LSRYVLDLGDLFHKVHMQAASRSAVSLSSLPAVVLASSGRESWIEGSPRS
jgi:hypothetical protein